MGFLKTAWRLVLRPVFLLGLLITAAVSFAVYQTIDQTARVTMEETGVARMEWIRQTVNRYANITGMVARDIESHGGVSTMTDDHIREMISLGSSIRSIQVIPEEGKARYFSNTGGTYDFSEIRPDFLLEAEDHARLMKEVDVQPKAEIARDAEGFVVVNPVFLKVGGNETYWGKVVLVADRASFLTNIGIFGLDARNVLCGLEQVDSDDGAVRMIYENGDYRDDPVKVSLVIFRDTWNLYIRPKEPWVNPMAILVLVWTGVLTSLALSHMFGRIIRLHRAGTTDALTGAFNRKGGNEAVSDYFHHHELEMAMVMTVDIDNFKLINDVHGHGAGDEALRCFVRDMRRIFGPAAILIRGGGDEFTILSGYKEIEDIRERMNEFTTRPHRFSYGGKEISFTSSMGCAGYPEEGMKFGELSRKADAALYEAKLSGKSKWKSFKGNKNTKTGRVQLGFNLSDVSEHMPGAMMVCRANESVDILFANSSALRLLGCDDYDGLMEYKKKGFYSIVVPEDLSAMKEKIRNPGEDGVNFVSYRIINAKGREVPVEGFGKLVDHPLYGKVYYVYVWDRNDRESRMG